MNPSFVNLIIFIILVTKSVSDSQRIQPNQRYSSEDANRRSSMFEIGVGNADSSSLEVDEQGGGLFGLGMQSAYGMENGLVLGHGMQRGQVGQGAAGGSNQGIRGGHVSLGSVSSGLNIPRVQVIGQGGKFVKLGGHALQFGHGVEEGRRSGQNGVYVERSMLGGQGGLSGYEGISGENTQIGLGELSGLGIQGGLHSNEGISGQSTQIGLGGLHANEGINGQSSQTGLVKQSGLGIQGGLHANEGISGQSSKIGLVKPSGLGIQGGLHANEGISGQSSKIGLVKQSGLGIQGGLHAIKGIGGQSSQIGLEKVSGLGVQGGLNAQEQLGRSRVQGGSGGQLGGQLGGGLGAELGGQMGNQFGESIGGGYSIGLPGLGGIIG